jgi:outer membrane protein
MKKIFFSVCLFIFATIEVCSQERVSLSDAIQIGLENNFSIQIEKKRLEIAQNNNTLGQAGMMPSVNANIGQNFTITELDNPAGFLRSGNIKGSTFNPGVAVSWNVFNGFNVQMTKDRLESLQQQSAGNTQIIVENTIQSIILAYYTALLEQQRLSVFDRTLSLSADRYTYIKMKAEMGTAVTFDMLQDKNSYLTDSSNFLTQELNYRNALRNLNLLLGQEVDTAIDLSDSLGVVPKEFVFDELYAAMSRTNSNLKNQFIAQETLKKDMGIAKSAMFPRLTLDLNGSKNSQVQDLSSAVFASGPSTITDAVSSSTLNYSAGLTLSYTLFNGGRVKNQIENSRINEVVGQLQTNELKLSLKNNLIGTYESYRLRKSLLAIAKENMATSQLNLQLATDRYQNGTISSFNFRDIQLNHLNNSLSYLQAIYNLIDVETQLMRLTGSITNTAE